jgi:hypothetical protein
MLAGSNNCVSMHSHDGLKGVGRNALTKEERVNRSQKVVSINAQQKLYISRRNSVNPWREIQRTFNALNVCAFVVFQSVSE